jgi:uncharacterized cupin superfamily protein
MDVHVELDTIRWQEDRPGARFKSFASGGQRLRLLELSEEFVEDDWCTEGHVVYVLDGELSVELKGAGLTRLQAGDASFLPAGEAGAHRPVLGPGERALLLLFELV